MPEIIHSTEITTDGPWLIGRQQLLELDRLVAVEWQKLTEHHASIIDSEVDQEFAEYMKRSSKEQHAAIDQVVLRKQIHERVSDRYGYTKKRSLIIHLSGARRVSAASFEEALRDPALLYERPIGFTIALRAADIECSLKVPARSCSLQLGVEPDRNAIAKGLFTSLKSWVDSVEPPSWQKIWLRLKSGGGQWILWLLVLSLALVYLSTFAPDTSAAARAARHDEAVFVLKSGISEKNQFKALELILSYESGAIPSSRTVSVPSWFWWLLCGGPIFCFALSFAPSVELGIGQGEESIKKWKQWMRIVGISFPTWIIGTIIWPKIQEWMVHLF